MKGYTTSTTVSEFLQTDITSGSVPSISTVNEWIEWAEDNIDRSSGYSYTTEGKTDLILAGNGNYEFWLPQEYLPLVSISQMEINTGSDFDQTWVEKTEGTDFLILNLDTGRIKFNTSGVTGFSSKTQQLKVDLVYGFSTIPHIVEEIATKMVAKKFIQSVASSASAGGNESIRVGPIMINDGSKDTVSFVQNLTEDIDNALKNLGTTRFYMY